MVTFEEKSHTYTNKEGKIYTSATTLVGMVKPKFDEDFWSAYKALEKILNFDKKFTYNWYLREKFGFQMEEKDTEHIELIAKKLKRKEEFDAVKVDILAEWAEKSLTSTDKGTAIHKAKEEKAFADGFGYFNDNIFGKTLSSAGVEDIYSLPDGYYPEMLLWNDENEIAGLADRIWLTTENNIRYADIDDYKSNKEIKTKSPYKMLIPVEHLDDCHLSHYSLQLSIYLWMLKQFGFTPREGRFTHIPDGNQETYYPIQYLEKEVESILLMKKQKDGKN